MKPMEGIRVVEVASGSGRPGLLGKSEDAFADEVLQHLVVPPATP
jgi:hypothetical protein